LKKIILIPLGGGGGSLIVGIASAATFTVSPLQKTTTSIGLSEGDKVSGSLSVVGGSGNDVNFYVTDPNANTIIRYDGITQTSFSFSASMTGTYTMHFDNSFSLFSSKSVTLDYSVTKAIAGIPQETFFLLVAIIVIVAIIIAVAIVLVRRKKE
jgi:hypothetical protein